MKLGCLSIVLLVLFAHDLEVLSAVNQSPKSSSGTKTTSQKTITTKNKKPANSVPPEALLSATYYEKTCPEAEAIIHRRMRAWINRRPSLAPAIIRLHFHDCALRGCDASVLLNHRGSERRAHASKTLTGFSVVNDIKRAIEAVCPRTVSCGDILTAAARDATVFSGGPFWEVPYGRRDGLVSLSREADSLVPQGRENVTVLLSFFASRGLTPLDLVVLSGSHTIGRASCSSLAHRLGPLRPDRSLNSTLLAQLKKKCGHNNSNNNLVDLDPTTPRVFDSVYYVNLMRKKGVLSTDQILFSDGRTAGFVEALATQPHLFESQFAVSMIKLGNVQVKTRPVDRGEIRVHCDFVNA